MALKGNLMAKSDVAEVLVREHEVEAHGVKIPHAETIIYTGDPRETAAQKLEEIARRIRSGELRGGRVEWRDGLAKLTTVELFPGRAVRLTCAALKDPSERVALVEGV